MNSDYFDNCNVKWTIFHDDDSVVNYQMVSFKIVRLFFFNVFKLVNNVLKIEDGETAKFRCLFANINPEHPLRSGKYAVDSNNFPMGYIYPSFCHGPAASFTKKASADIFEIAKTHRHGLHNWKFGACLSVLEVFYEQDGSWLVNARFSQIFF